MSTQETANLVAVRAAIAVLKEVKTVNFTYNDTITDAYVEGAVTSLQKAADYLEFLISEGK